jgi:hypothetical protein
LKTPRLKFILSKFVVDKTTAKRIKPNFIIDDESLTTLRSVFIKHWNTLSEKLNYVDLLVEEILAD